MAFDGLEADPPDERDDATAVGVLADDALLRAGLDALCARAGLTVCWSRALPGAGVGRASGARVEAIVCAVNDASFARSSACAWLVREATPWVAFVRDEASARAAVSAGAQGVVGSTGASAALESKRLGAAVRAVSQGLSVFDPRYGRTHAAAPPIARGEPAAHEGLTARELDVLRGLTEGLSNKGIAARLRISEHTVKTHVNAILSKLEADSRTDAVVRAARLGLVLL